MHMGTANAGALLFKNAVLGSSLLKSALDGRGGEFIEVKWLDGGGVQILCTQILLFLHFRSREIARSSRLTMPRAVVALGRWRKW